MKTISIKRTVIAILTPFVILSCTDLYLKDIKDASFDTSLAVPIGSAKVEVSTFLESMDTTLISSDNATGEISIIWEGEPIEQHIFLDDLAPDEPTEVIEDVALDQYEPFTTVLGALPVGSEHYVPIDKEDLEEMDYTINFYYDYNEFNTDENFDIKISKIQLKKTDFDVDINIEGININENNKLNLELIFPDMFGDNNEKVHRKTITSSTGSMHIEMNDFFIEFGENDSLTIPVVIKMTIDSDGSLEANKKAKVNVVATATISECEKVWGTINESHAFKTDYLDFELPELPFMAGDDGNNLFFSNPQITMNIKSDLGLPAVIRLDSMYAKNESGETVYAKFNSEESLDIRLEQPATEDGDIRKSVTLDKDNGELNKIFAIMPNKLHCKYSVSVDSESESKDNYINRESNIDIDIRAEIPLSFDEGTSFAFQDTSALDMSALGGNLDSLGVSIEQLNLYIKAENMMPFSLSASAIFIDDAGNEVYRQDGINIPSANIDAEGQAISAKVTELNPLEFTGTDINDMLKSTQIIFSINVKGKDQNSKIKLTMEDNVSFKISAFAKAGITININSDNQ